MNPISVAILAGGEGNRFKQSKALTNVAGKPLILHVVDTVEACANEVFIVVHSEEDRDKLSGHLPKNQIIADIPSEQRCPLVGALSAFEHAKYSFTQLLPCDSPLIHPMFFEILWNMVESHNAAIPRWPNGWVEPLHAVYRTDISAEVAKMCLEEEKPRMQCLIDGIDRIIYLSTLALERFDPKLHTFLNVNTPADLRRVERLLRQKEKF